MVRLRPLWFLRWTTSPRDSPKAASFASVTALKFVSLTIRSGNTLCWHMYSHMPQLYGFVANRMQVPVKIHWFIIMFSMCTLWWTNIAMKNHHLLWENPLFLWPFSIAMLVHQRVYPMLFRTPTTAKSSQGAVVSWWPPKKPQGGGWLLPKNQPDVPPFFIK